MQLEPPHESFPQSDDWLAAQCQRIEAAGRDLALAVGEINERIEEALLKETRRPSIPENCLQRARECAVLLHGIQVEVQNALFDCEHEIRDLREREVSPAELLIDGERLIQHYRFLRRRARLIDALLAYLPDVCSDTHLCVEHLRQMHEEEDIAVAGPLTVPDCSFAVMTLEALREEEESQRLPRYR